MVQRLYRNTLEFGRLAWRVPIADRIQNDRAVGQKEKRQGKGRTIMTIETKFDENDFAYRKIYDKQGLNVVDMFRCEICSIDVEVVAGETYIYYNIIDDNEDDYSKQIAVWERDLCNEEEYINWLNEE